MSKPIVVLAGGPSAEREVSFATAKTIEQSLDRQGISWREIDAADHTWLTQALALDPIAVIIALHGPYGEDGTVQRMLEEARISYTGSDSNVSALTIDKIATKAYVSKNIDINVAQSYLTKEDITYPVVVKPNKQGSSYGTSIVRTEHDFSAAMDLAKRYDEDGEVIIEEYLKGRELTCGIIDIFGTQQALPVVEIVPSHEYFDYESKYDTESGCQEIVPANISADLTEKIQTLSKEIYTKLNTRQYARIDWIVRDDIPYFLEINTLPGMTPTSLITKELAAAKIDFDKFIAQLVETASKIGHKNR